MLATHRFPAASKASALGLTPVSMNRVETAAPLVATEELSKRTMVWLPKLATHRRCCLSNAIAAGLLSEPSFDVMTIDAGVTADRARDADGKAMSRESLSLVTHIVPSLSK